MNATKELEYIQSIGIRQLLNRMPVSVENVNSAVIDKLVIRNTNEYNKLSRIL